MSNRTTAPVSGRDEEGMSAQPHVGAESANPTSLNTLEGEYSVSGGGVDPYMPPDECPRWCRTDGHQPHCAEEDRRHYGSAFFLPIRSFRATYLRSTDDDPSCVVLTDLCMSLEQPALYREPQISVELPDPFRMLKFTLGEAAAISEALARLVAEALGGEAR